MKKASDTMYRIAKIIAIIWVPLFFVVASIYLGLGVYHLVNDAPCAEDFAKMGKYIAIAIGAVVALIVTSIMLKNHEEDPKDKAPNIVCIVMGVIGSNPFFILGGIFGLVAQAQDEEPAEKKEETSAEEKPEE